MRDSSCVRRGEAYLSQLGGLLTLAAEEERAARGLVASKKICRGRSKECEKRQVDEPIRSKKTSDWAGR